VGDTDVIGEKFFHRLAGRQQLLIDAQSAARGLLPDIQCLEGPGFSPGKLNGQIVRFYQETSRFSFDVTPEWKGGMRPLARLVSILFSRRLRQLNVPLSSADTLGGTSSEIFPVRRGEKHLFSAWIRTLRSSGSTLYVGAYSTALIPGHGSPCIKVVFPLPNGSAMVFMRPELRQDGSLLLLSEGERFGDPGFYFYVHRDASGGVARYVRALRESIFIYPGEGLDVHADHDLSFFGRGFLRQHYEMRQWHSQAE
jgi:hypothetical protein